MWLSLFHSRESYVKVEDPVEFFESPDRPSKSEEPGMVTGSVALQELLLSGPHRFVFAPEADRAKTVVFGQGGVILDGNNQNEHRWRISKGMVEILDTDGAIFSRFRYNPNSNRFESTNDADTKAFKGQYFDIKKSGN
jgi:hypothetical protein